VEGAVLAGRDQQRAEPGVGGFLKLADDLFFQLGELIRVVLQVGFERFAVL